VTAVGAREDDWWRTGVVYQVYPRSFADGNGDGIGDLAGLIGHLDHLNDGTPASLGVDAIWLSPIYPSPGLDLGYDVADHGAVDPAFGTMADFDRLVAETHRRGMRLILDLVMNHTSDAHRWFEESRASRDNGRAAWYLWRDPAGFEGAGRPRLPNNWVSFFGGPAWTWEPRRAQFYLHTFLPQQPDLNWRHPDVRAAQWSMVRGWLDHGVDGFRLDVFNALLKAEGYPSNPPLTGGHGAWDRQLHLYDKDQPELRELMTEFRSIVDERPGRMSVGELFAGTTAQAAGLWEPRHLVFDFRLLGLPWSAAAFAEAIDEREAAFGPDAWPTVVLSNHDNRRVVSRFWRAAGTSARGRDAVARAAALLLLTLRGTPFLYYGEEIGMRDIRVARAAALDAPARRRGFRWWNRDQCRAPMPWNGGPNAGFTTGRPWLPLPADARTRNVAGQGRDPRSVLAFQRKLLAFRRASAALRGGTLRRFETSHPDVLGYVRSAPGRDAAVLVNFSSAGAAARVECGPANTAWRPALGTHEPLGEFDPGSGRLFLRPLEGTILLRE